MTLIVPFHLRTAYGCIRGMKHTVLSQTKSVKPIRLRGRRGRPAKKLAEPTGDTPDTGTPELAAKRQRGLTAEPIDLCLERGLISEDQHRVALHLRWLYTIRYGAPGITAFDMTRGPGLECFVEDDPLWRMHRERDYLEAIELLRQAGYADELLPLIIDNQRPAYLSAHQLGQGLHCAQTADTHARRIARLAEGLELLVEWRKANKGKPKRPQSAPVDKMGDK